MCGPSSAMKNINTQIQNLSASMASEAKSAFSTANDAVQRVLGSVKGIVAGGPSQAGFSQNQKNAMDAAAVQNGATEARNLKAVAASGAAAVGGGNVPTASGLTESSILNAEQTAATDTATALNKNVQADYQQGNENYWKGIDATTNAPKTLDVANNFNTNALSGAKEAATSQQNIDTQSNWWKSDIMKLGTAAAGFATGGFGNMLSGSDNSFLSGVGDAMKSSQEG